MVWVGVERTGALSLLHLLTLHFCVRYPPTITTAARIWVYEPRLLINLSSPFLVSL